VIKKIEYLGFSNCLEIASGDASVIISTDFGPRILSYALDDGENILGWHPEAAVKTKLGTWKPYGGHRLWLAPENMPLSYSPDNEPVEHFVDGALSVRLVPLEDANAKIQKEIAVSLDDEGSDVTIDHKITNRGDSTIEASAWALTIMRPGGTVVVPNEPLAPYGRETLLPVRTLALWPYTDFTDPRWSFGKDEIGLRVDENLQDPQKFGVLNRQGWVAYEWNDLRFVKYFDFVDGVPFPDMNSNTEIYTAGGFVEVETLSPLTVLQPGESVKHQERWELESNVEVRKQ